VNELSSPTFFAPLPFQGAMPQAAGATSARNDHGNSSAHGVKRDASQMMTSEERSERVRKIVSLVKVLLTAKTIKEDSVPSLVVPGVFLGSVGAAHDKSSLDANGITHILTVAGGFPPKFPESYDYLVVDVADASCENLTSHFDACLKFIARALLDGGNVLVHCFAGRSRSTTVVAAYVMATEGYSFKETMTLIKRVRPAAQPNAGFVAQLVAFEKHLEKARAEGRLLGRVQLEGEIENEHDLSGINHLASVAVDVAACLESDTSSVDSESPRGEEGELVAEKNPAGAERQVLTKETGTDARASKRTPSSPTGGGEKTHSGRVMSLGR